MTLIVAKPLPEGVVDCSSSEFLDGDECIILCAENLGDLRPELGFISRGGDGIFEKSGDIEMEPGWRDSFFHIEIGGMEIMFWLGTDCSLTYWIKPSKNDKDVIIADLKSKVEHYEKVIDHLTEEIARVK